MQIILRESATRKSEMQTGLFFWGLFQASSYKSNKFRLPRIKPRWIIMQNRRWFIWPTFKKTVFSKRSCCLFNRLPCPFLFTISSNLNRHAVLLPTHIQRFLTVCKAFSVRSSSVLGKWWIMLSYHYNKPSLRKAYCFHSYLVSCHAQPLYSIKREEKPKIWKEF